MKTSKQLISIALCGLFISGCSDSFMATKADPKPAVKSAADLNNVLVGKTAEETARLLQGAWYSPCTESISVDVGTSAEKFVGFSRDTLVFEANGAGVYQSKSYKDSNCIIEESVGLPAGQSNYLDFSYAVTAEENEKILVLNFYSPSGEALGYKMVHSLLITAGHMTMTEKVDSEQAQYMHSDEFVTNFYSSSSVASNAKRKVRYNVDFTSENGELAPEN